MRRLLLSTLLFALGTAAPAAAQLPIFDAHVHYSRPDWDVFSPDRALAILTAAGVRRAIVSSTPDDGTLRLYEKAPKRIVPFLRPYRTLDDMGSWHRDPGVQAYVENRLKRGIYRGIGEFHLSASDAGGATVKRFAELAAERDLFLQAHVDDVTIEKLLTLYPRARLLWAHAGMSASASTVGGLLARFPKLWVDLSGRTDVAADGRLDPKWRAVFVKYPDRFMVGTDMWVTSRWEAMRNYYRVLKHVADPRSSLHLLERFPKLWSEFAYPFMVGTDTWVTSRHRDIQTWLGQLPRRRRRGDRLEERRALVFQLFLRRNLREAKRAAH